MVASCRRLGVAGSQPRFVTTPVGEAVETDDKRLCNVVRAVLQRARCTPALHWTLGMQAHGLSQPVLSLLFRLPRTQKGLLQRSEFYSQRVAYTVPIFALSSIFLGGCHFALASLPPCASHVPRRVVKNELFGLPLRHLRTDFSVTAASTKFGTENPAALSQILDRPSRARTLSLSLAHPPACACLSLGACTPAVTNLPDGAPCICLALLSKMCLAAVTQAACSCWASIPLLWQNACPMVLLSCHPFVQPPKVQMNI